MTRYHTLNNGLSVLLIEDFSAPVVSFWTWYRVGSRFERLGQTGISHWVEHMLLKGGTRLGPGRLTKRFSRLGAHFDAYTSSDYTVFFETLPVSAWELAPEVEADRMFNTPLFTPEDTERERTVILSERGISENYPAIILAEEVTSLAFKVHPYRQPVIGWPQDLERITCEDLFEHYRTYYAPNNAVIVLAGAVREEEALSIIDQYFDRIQPGSVRYAPVLSEPPQEGERRMVLERPGGAVPIVHTAYHVPQTCHEDTVALMVLDAVLSGGKPIRRFQQNAMGQSSRLYQSLIRTKLATSAGSNLSSTVDPGLFEVAATGQAGVKPESIEAAMIDEIERLHSEPVPEFELQRATKQIRAQIAYGLDNPVGRAWWQGLLEHIKVGDWFEALTELIARITPEDVQRMARSYLHRKNRTVGWYVPDRSDSELSSSDIAASLGGAECA